MFPHKRKKSSPPKKKEKCHISAEAECVTIFQLYNVVQFAPVISLVVVHNVKRTKNPNAVPTKKVMMKEVLVIEYGRREGRKCGYWSTLVNDYVKKFECCTLTTFTLALFLSISTRSGDRASQVMAMLNTIVRLMVTF